MPPEPPTSSREGAKRAASKLNPAAAKLGRTLSDAAAEKADQNRASVSTTASIRVDVSGASKLRRAIWAITGCDPNLQVWGMKWPDWGLPLVKQESKSAELSDNYVVKHAQTKYQRLYEELQKRKKAAANAKLAAENATQKEVEAKKALTDAGFTESCHSRNTLTTQPICPSAAALSKSRAQLNGR